MESSPTSADQQESYMVDVHTHLTDSVFTNDISNVIDRAVSSNVKAALVVSESISDFPSVLQLFERFPNFVLPCLGIHPVQNTGTYDDKGLELQRSVSLLDYENVESMIQKSLDVIGAIGEIGLDFSPRFCQKEDDKEIQRAILTKQVQYAQRHNLPVNVHSRSAGKHAIQLLKELDAKNVLLHAFDGRASVALEGASCGFYFSVTAAICRDPQTQKMVKTLPLDKLMLETDSPAIAPVKGAVNEPANAEIGCEHIAKIKGVDIQDVRRITTENALKVFPRLKQILKL